MQLRHGVCSLLTVADFGKITFVRSTKRQSMRPGVRQEVINLDVPVLHPDGRPMSICTRYLLWATDGTVLDPHLIDIWRHGTDLYLFLRDDEPRSAEYVSNPIVRLKFPTRSEWENESRKDLENHGGYTPDVLRMILTDDAYAHALRKQVQAQFPNLDKVLRFEEYKTRRAATTEGFERYDALELYKEYLRNLIRVDLKKIDESKSKMNRGWAERHAEPKSLAAALPSSPEEWAAELDTLPPDLRNVMFGLARERTVRELGLMDRDDSAMHTQGRARDGTRFSVMIDGRDTLSTFKQKVSDVTGIPGAALGLIVAGRVATELEQLFIRPREVNFVALDMIEQQRRRP